MDGVTVVFEHSKRYSSILHSHIGGREELAGCHVLKMNPYTEDAVVRAVLGSCVAERPMTCGLEGAWG